MVSAGRLPRRPAAPRRLRCRQRALPQHHHVHEGEHQDDHDQDDDDLSEHAVHLRIDRVAELGVGRIERVDPFQDGRDILGHRRVHPLGQDQEVVGADKLVSSMAMRSSTVYEPTTVIACASTGFRTCPRSVE